MIYDENDEYQNIDEYGGNWKIVIDSELIDVYEYKEDAIEALLEELKILNNDENISYINNLDYDLLISELESMDYDSLYQFIDNVLDEIDLYDSPDIKIICINNDEPEFSELQY
jgi:hypothetical protein